MPHRPSSSPPGSTRSANEGIAYAERLGAEGVKVHHLHYDDMIHGFATLASITPRTNEMLDAVGADLRDLF